MEDQNRDHVTIQIEEKLAQAEPILTSQCCIYRVPYEIRKKNPDAYTPVVVSIGPLHHGNPKLQNMESQKLIFCKEFKERAQTSFDNLIKCVQELETSVRGCYSENVELSEEKLVELILVDCGFILVLFLTRYFLDGKHATIEWKEEDALTIVFKNWMHNCITSDLLLLENQLPFFALEKLYNLAFPPPQYPSFLDLIVSYFSYYNIINFANHYHIMNHFTDMVRISYLGSPQPYARSKKYLGHLYCATKLHEAGVKFRIKKHFQNIIEMEFSGSYLEIPELELTEYIEATFLNLIALEQCHYNGEAYITDYLVFFDYLINTSKDVDVLVESGILKNMLGDKDAVNKLFNGFNNNLSCVDFNSHYIGIAEKLNAYCDDPWNSKKATLRRDYCGTPWQTAASSAGVVLLLLTFIQTVSSILQLKHH